MKKEKIKKFFGSKIFMFCFLFTIFGIATIIATGIGSSGYSGIQVDNYYSGNGNQGITQNISFEDADGNNHSLEFEDGLLINYSLEEPPEPPEFPREGLIIYHSLDEDSGSNVQNNATSLIGFSDNSTAVNGTVLGESGVLGNAVTFTDVYNSGNQKVIINPTLNRPVTSEGLAVSVWARLYASTGTQEHPLVAANDQSSEQSFQLTQDQDDYLRGKLFTSGASPILIGTTNISDRTWHHFVLNYNRTASNFSIYVDGILESNTTLSYALNSGTGFGINAWDDTLFSNDQFLGEIDEVGIWNRSLTSEEIELLYNDGEGFAYSN